MVELFKDFSSGTENERRHMADALCLAAYGEML
jgi:hypothetical protein